MPVEIPMVPADDPNPDEIDIATAAAGPKRTRTEEGTVEERSIQELIAAQEYLNGQNAPTEVPWGLRKAKVRYGSTTE